jgi:hypothetical protein
VPRLNRGVGVKRMMDERDWIELARRARDAAERSLAEEAYWLRLAAGARAGLREVSDGGAVAIAAEVRPVMA